MSDVRPVGEARAELTRTLRRFREDPGHAAPVVLGSHRAPEAVILPYAQYIDLTTGAGETGGIRAVLHERRGLIERLARASGLVDVRVFGSVARGDDTPASDVDLLVTPGPEASLFDLVRFQLDAEAVLGRGVDVVSRRSLDPLSDREILAEATAL